MRGRPLVFLALFFACTLPCAAGKKRRIPIATLPDQSVELADLPAITAAHPCANWAWAAGVETMLHDRGVELGQAFWVQKANGGELCVDDLGDLARLAGVVAGDYVLADGSHVAVTAHAVTGPPAEDLDDLIAALKQDHTVVVVWSGRPYLLRGLVYNEYIAPSGQRVFEFREMRLIDPSVASGDHRMVRFVRDQDDPAAIDGTFDLAVSSPDGTDWLRRKTPTPPPPPSDWTRQGDRPQAPPTDWTRQGDRPAPAPPTPAAPPADQPH